MTENAPAGWYQSETDPPGTERYWDGAQWSAETRAVMAPPPPAVVAGERTVLGRELASPWLRIGARLLDGVFLLIILFPIGLILGLADVGITNLAANDISNEGGYVVLALVAAAYEILFTALKSATPGKMAVGIEIIRKADGQTPLGFGTAALRWVPNVISYLNANLGGLVTLASLVLIFADQQRRSVGDFVGQTYVVRKQR